MRRCFYTPLDTQAALRDSEEEAARKTKPRLSKRPDGNDARNHQLLPTGPDGFYRILKLEQKGTRPWMVTPKSNAANASHTHVDDVNMPPDADSNEPMPLYRAHIYTCISKRQDVPTLLAPHLPRPSILA